MNSTAPGFDRAADSPGLFHDLARAPVPWAGADTDVAADVNTDAGADADADASSQRLLFVRALARRNFAGFPFWVSCSHDTCAALTRQADAQARAENLTASYRLAALSPDDIGILRERMLLPEHPVSFPETRDFKRVFLARAPQADTNPDTDPDAHVDPRTGHRAAGQTHVLFGEVEHWTRIHTRGPTPAPAQPATSSPFPPESALHILAENARLGARDADPQSPVFAQTEPWGFPTSDPAYAGTGLQFEAGLHLPALSAPSARPLLLQVSQALAATGYDLQPLSLREPGSAASGFFRLTSRGSMEITEAEQAALFATRMRAVLRAETEAWTEWNAREARQVEDRMHRALRILQEARQLELSEAYSLISFARAGVYADVFPALLLPKLETLRVRAQPFHVRALATGDSEGIESADSAQASLRAGLARRLLSLM